MPRPLGDTARLWAVLQDAQPHPRAELEALVKPGSLNQRLGEVRRRFDARVDATYDRGRREWSYRLRPVSAMDAAIETLRTEPRSAPTVVRALDGLTPEEADAEYERLRAKEDRYRLRLVGGDAA